VNYKFILCYDLWQCLLFSGSINDVRAHPHLIIQLPAHVPIPFDYGRVLFGRYMYLKGKLLTMGFVHANRYTFARCLVVTTVESQFSIFDITTTLVL